MGRFSRNLRSLWRTLLRSLSAVAAPEPRKAGWSHSVAPAGSSLSPHSCPQEMPTTPHPPPPHPAHLHRAAPRPPASSPGARWTQSPRCCSRFPPPGAGLRTGITRASRWAFRDGVRGPECPPSRLMIPRQSSRSPSPVHSSDLRRGASERSPPLAAWSPSGAGDGHPALSHSFLSWPPLPIFS